MTKKPIKLYSFSICPFVQKSRIVLNKKGVDYEIEYIDLKNKPEWFLKISPLGKVPVLAVGGANIFESSIINEYIDEAYPPNLHPKEPIFKAHHRAWIEFSSELIMNQYRIFIAKDDSSFAKEYNILTNNLNRLEDELSAGSRFFSGNEFSLVDASFAPIFFRYALLNSQLNFNVLGSHQKLQKWSINLLGDNSVLESVPDSFEADFMNYFKEEGGVLFAHKLLSH